MARRSAAVVPPAPASRWVSVAGAVSLLLILATAFFPDEKITRLKWLALQLGVMSTGALVMLRGAVQGRLGRGEWPASVAAATWIVVTAAFVAAAPDKALAVTEALRVAMAAGAFLVFSHADFDARWLKRLLLGWTVGATLVSVYGILQHAGGMGRLLVPQMDRVIGSFGNPIFFSSFLVASLFVAAAVRSLFPTGPVRPVIAVAGALQAGALLFTQTRSAFLALAVSCGALVYLGRRDRRMVLVAAVAIAASVVAMILFLNRDQAHALIWRDTLKLWLTKPLMGVGLGAFHIHFPDVAGADLRAKWPAGSFVVNYAHNEFLQVLAEGGVAALVAFLALPVLMLAAIRRRSADTVTLLLGVAGLSGYFQNAASADFRFGVSQVLSCVLLGLAASRSREGAEPQTVPFSARGPMFLIGVFFLPFAAAMLWTSHARQQQAAVAPGFFEERVRDPDRVIAEREATAPETAEELEALGYVYAKEMRRPDGSPNLEMSEKAVAAFRRVVALDPKRTSAQNNLGNVLFTMGRSEEAAAAWARAAELDPTFLDPRLNLGKTAYMRGDLKLAARHFQDVLKIQPGNAEAALYLRRMVE